MSSISYIVALLGPTLASTAMTTLLWLPFFIGLGLLALAIPFIFILPDHPHQTNRRPTARRYVDEQSRPLISSPVLKAQQADDSVLRSILARFNTLSSILSSHPRNLTLLFISFFLTSLASSDTKLLAQYISKRYHWTFASAGYILSGKAVVNFFLLTIVIPSLLRSRHSTASQQASSTDRANLRYAHACLMVSVLGALAIALSAEVWLLIPSLLVYALGSALPIFTLSLLKSPAISPPAPDDLAGSSDLETHIFSLVMMTKTLGSLVGAPLMAVLWITGISHGGVTMGMPYFASGSLYLVASFIISGIRV
jgi:hypothetical protein